MRDVISLLEDAIANAETDKRKNVFYVANSEP